MWLILLPFGSSTAFHLVYLDLIAMLILVLLLLGCDEIAVQLGAWEVGGVWGPFLSCPRWNQGRGRTLRVQIWSTPVIPGWSHHRGNPLTQQPGAEYVDD